MLTEGWAGLYDISKGAARPTEWESFDHPKASSCSSEYDDPTMTGSMAEAFESEEDRRAILEGFRALKAEVTVWSLTCEAKGRLDDDDDEADETESDRDEGQIEGRLGVFATGRRGPEVYEHETPRWMHRVHESLSPSHLAFLERQASHAWRG